MSWQVNFLLDEAGDCEKGANTVLSRIHYFFENHRFGEKDVYLYANNCTSQNKLVSYFAWLESSVLPLCFDIQLCRI